MTENRTTDDGGQRTIRLFPDYADTVLWIREPIDYEDTGLSDELVAGMRAWEQFYYDSLDADFNWVSAEAARTFTEEGTRLAQSVSSEVGSRFLIEFASYKAGTETVRRRSAHPAENAEAERAFAKLFDEIEVEDREIADYIRNNPGGKWTAYAPLSGTVFDPNPNWQTEAPSEDD